MVLLARKNRRQRERTSAGVKGRRFLANARSRALRAGAGRHAEPVQQLAASGVSGEQPADASGRGISARRRQVRATREPVADLTFGHVPLFHSAIPTTRDERKSSTAPLTSPRRAQRDTRASPSCVSDIPPTLLSRLAAPRCSCPDSRPRALPCPKPWTAFSLSSCQRCKSGTFDPPGGSSAILFNPLGSTCPQGESPPDPSAAKKTYISGYVLERHAPVPFPPTPCDSSLLPSDPRTSRRTLSLPSTQAQDREQRGDAHIHSVFHRTHPVSLRLRSFVQARDAESDSRAQGTHWRASLRV